MQMFKRSLRKAKAEPTRHSLARPFVTAVACFILCLAAATLLPPPASTQGQEGTSIVGQNERARQIRTDLIGGREVAAGEALVKFRDLIGTPGGTIEGTVAQAVQAADAESVELVGRGEIHLIGSRSKDAATLIRELSARPDVEYAEPNYIIRIDAVPNDARFSSTLR